MKGMAEVVKGEEKLLRANTLEESSNRNLEYNLEGGKEDGMLGNIGVNSSRVSPICSTKCLNGGAKWEAEGAWVNVVGKSRESNIRLNCIAPGESWIQKCLPIPKCIGEEGSRKWNNFLAGHFIDSKLPYSLVKTIAFRHWAKLGLMNVLSNDRGFYFFQFSSEDELIRVLEGGP